MGAVANGDPQDLVRCAFAGRTLQADLQIARNTACGSFGYLDCHRHNECGWRCGRCLAGCTRLRGLSRGSGNSGAHEIRARAAELHFQVVVAFEGAGIRGCGPDHGLTGILLDVCDHGFADDGVAQRAALGFILLALAQRQANRRNVERQDRVSLFTRPTGTVNSLVSVVKGGCSASSWYEPAERCRTRSAPRHHSASSAARQSIPEACRMRSTDRVS